MSETERPALIELLALLKGLHTTLHAVCGDAEVLLRGLFREDEEVPAAIGTSCCVQETFFNQ